MIATKQTIFKWLTSIIVVCSLSYSYIKTQSVNFELHSKISGELRYLRQLDSDLNSDILRIRVNLLNNYDSLVETWRKITLVRNSLHNSVEKIGGSAQINFSRQHQAITIIFLRKGKLLERYKSQVVVLKNSLHFFPIANMQLQRLLPLGDNRQAIARALNRLERYGLLYYLTDDDKLKEDINIVSQQLNRLMKSQSVSIQKVILNFIAHVRITIRQEDLITQLTKELQDLPSDKQLEEFYVLFSAHHDQLLSANKYFRLSLYFLSIILLLFTLYTLARLKSANKHLEQEELDLRQHRDKLEARVRERTLELTTARDSAQTANKAKSDFLAIMSHELRTPLNSIIGFSDILKDGIAGEINSEQNKQLGMINNSAKHLLSLINDILDLSKIEAGKMKIKTSKFSISSLLEDLYLFLLPQSDSKGLKLNIDRSKSMYIYSDYDKLRQILLNLLGNAIKFTSHGSVTVSLDRQENTLYIAVIDTGIGIGEKDNYEKIFDNFHQQQTADSRQYEGTGLGLAISKQFSEMMGGTISVLSTLGEGSCFTLCLPGVIIPQEKKPDYLVPTHKIPSSRNEANP